MAERAPSVTPTITLRVVLPGAPDRTVTLNGPVVTVGRDARSHLALDHDAIARRHAVFDCTSRDHWRVIDLGSGTMVNGAAINSLTLAVGDVVGIGAAALEVLALVQPSDVPAQPAPAASRPTATAAPVDLVGALRASARRGVARLVRWARAIEREEGGHHG